jgi:hypothetical protein
VQPTDRRQQTRPPLPLFTEDTARQKAKMAEDALNPRDPETTSLAVTSVPSSPEGVEGWVSPRFGRSSRLRGADVVEDTEVVEEDVRREDIGIDDDSTKLNL